MDNKDNKDSVEAKVAAILRENGWYHNDGWRRDADSRHAGAMPPALSMGEAIDEHIGYERRVMYAPVSA